MGYPKQPFYKGIPGFTREREEDLWWEAEHGIYGWWWRYLRLSPVFWFARVSGHAPASPALAKTWAEAGDLSGTSFSPWWQVTGADLFAEEQRPRHARLIDENKLGEFVFYPQGKSIIVEIPLTISQGTISRQIRKLLAQHHEGRKLDVMAHSSAKWALHTKRFNLETLKKEYWARLYRLLYPDIAAWRVGDRLKLAPGLNLRDLDRWKFNHSTSPLTRMSSTVGRYLYKAQWTVWNAERRSFPNATKATPTDKPFGPRLNSEFLDATTSRKEAKSPWHEWLHQQYHEELVTRIRRKNHISGMAAIDPKLLERLPKFIAGQSDLLR